MLPTGTSTGMDEILLICIPKKLGCTSEILPLQVSKMLINASITFIFLDLNGFSTTRASRSASSATCGSVPPGPPQDRRKGGVRQRPDECALTYKMVTVSVSVASRTPRVATGV